MLKLSTPPAWPAVLVLLTVAACQDPFVSSDGGGFDLSLDLGGEGLVLPDGDAGVVTGDGETYLYRGTVVTPDTVIQHGEVLTFRDTILCVAASCQDDPKAGEATVVDTAGIIFPGLIDSHNHTQYNYLPLWEHTKMYTNHNQWQGSDEYATFIGPHRTLQDTLMCEMIKYGEIRSLVAGTTTIQGTPYRKCADTLIRNADLPYHGFSCGDVMRTNVIGSSVIDPDTANKLNQEFDSGETRSYVIHLAEGIDETARKEFDVLESLDLLKPQVIIIHGTALGPTEVAKMRQAGMPLIWSPTSNLDLYGATNNIKEVWDAGIVMALAPDWTPSGAPNVIDELRAAWIYNVSRLGGLWTAKELVLMVTSRAAEVIQFGEEIGKLQRGMRADLMVLHGDPSQPYDALVRAKLSQVRLVVVEGKPLYGDPGLMGALAPNEYCETLPICGASKVICVKEQASSEDKLDQSLGDIVNALEQGYTPGILGLSTCE